MLELRPGNLEIRILRLRDLELSLRLRDGLVGCDAGLELRASNIERVSIRGDRLVEEPLEGILRAQFVVIACSVKRTFARSAALACAAYAFARTVLLSRPQRSGAHDASNGSTYSPKVPLPGALVDDGAGLWEPLVAGVEDEDGLTPPKGGWCVATMLGLVVTVGNSCARACRVSARAAMKLAIAAAML